MTSTTSTPTGEKLTDPQARCLTATGDEAEALEAAWQAHLDTIWSAEFLPWCDALVEAIIPGGRCWQRRRLKAKGLGGG